MKNKLNHVLVIVFLFFTTNVYSNPIEKINFIGLNNTTENTLLKEIPLKVGDEYSDSASDTIIQSLFQTGLFSDISVTSNEGNINITLVENPTIKFFVFNIDLLTPIRGVLIGFYSFGFSFSSLRRLATVSSILNKSMGLKSTISAFASDARAPG